MALTRRTIVSSAAATITPMSVTHGFGQSTPVASPTASDVPGSVKTRLLKVLDAYGVPGATIGLTTPQTPDPVIIELGVANLTTGEPISADMHFRIASVTKTFVATVVLQLVDQGLLALNDTVADILPDLDVVNTHVVTVQNLLQMRSGLPQLADNPDYLRIVASDADIEINIDQIFGLAIGQPARAEPDTVFDYNNLNFDILGEIVHVVTDSAWHENVQSRISGPLGLENTLFAKSPELPTPFAHGYGYLDQELPTEPTAATPEVTPVLETLAGPAATPVNDAGAYDLTSFNPTVAGAAGGMISTIRDQVVWAEAFANGALISSELYTRQIETMPMDDTGTVGYGFGMIDFGGLYAHNGAINGFQSFVAGSPDFGVNVAALANCHPTVDFADVATLLVVELLNG